MPSITRNTSSSEIRQYQTEMQSLSNGLSSLTYAQDVSRIANSIGSISFSDWKDTVSTAFQTIVEQLKNGNETIGKDISSGGFASLKKVVSNLVSQLSYCASVKELLEKWIQYRDSLSPTNPDGSTNTYYTQAVNTVYQLESQFDSLAARCNEFFILLTEIQFNTNAYSVPEVITYSDSIGNPPEYVPPSNNQDPDYQAPINQDPINQNPINQGPGTDDPANEEPAETPKEDPETPPGGVSKEGLTLNEYIQKCREANDWRDERLLEAEYNGLEGEYDDLIRTYRREEGPMYGESYEDYLKRRRGFFGDKRSEALIKKEYDDFVAEKTSSPIPMSHESLDEYVIRRRELFGDTRPYAEIQSEYYDYTEPDVRDITTEGPPLEETNDGDEDEKPGDADFVPAVPSIPGFDEYKA